MFHEVGVLQGEDGWNSIITGLTEFDGPTFRDQVAEPLVELSANAYRYPDVIEVPGWIPSAKVAPIAPVGGGMHALVYEVGQLHIDCLGFHLVASLLALEFGDYCPPRSSVLISIL